MWGQSVRVVAGAVLAALSLSACGGGAPDPGAAPKREAADAAYVAAPEVTAVSAQGGRAQLSGKAAPGATARLRTPQGAVTEAAADAQGHWRMAIPLAAEPALYALSERYADGRVVQSEGYLLVTPAGTGALLRAGAGAVRLGPQVPATGVTAFDFDRGGSAVVSGRGPAGGAISARLDGKKIGESRIDPEGRFSIAFVGALNPGPHSIKVFGDSVDASLNVEVTPAAPLTGGPLRATPTASGLRVDWMTPGGGVQSTLLTS